MKLQMRILTMFFCLTVSNRGVCWGEIHEACQFAWLNNIPEPQLCLHPLARQVFEGKKR